MMINYITIDGVRSDPLLRFDKIPLFPMAERVSESYDAGGDQTVSYLIDQYKDIQLNLTAHIIGGRSILDVYSWLTGGKTLTLSTHPDVYAKLKTIGKIEPDRVGYSAHKIAISFTLAPFKYAVDNPEIVLTNGQQIYNRGSIYSRPVWRIYSVKSDFALVVNGEQLSISTDAGQTVTIDTERMIAYSGTTVILDKTIGKLPLLNAGINNISWIGVCDRVTVQQNARWI